VLFLKTQVFLTFKTDCHNTAITGFILTATLLFAMDAAAEVVTGKGSAELPKIA
jgi:hypothetical protein